MGELGRPAYLRLADVLRSRILSGEHPPGTRMPSIADLCRRHGLSEQPVRQALRVLNAEGLTEGRPGSGTYVRCRPAPARIPRGRYDAAGSPFAGASRDPGPGGVPHWTHDSQKTWATGALALRLGIAEGDPIMQTQYVFLAADRPAQLSTSWEPLALTGGTVAARPEYGPLAGLGVVERMAGIGLTVTRVTEDVTARPVLEAESGPLGVALGSTVLSIERTHWAGGLPVETADIVLAAERSRLVYEIGVPTEITPESDVLR
ncbi:GntR family transcriptional regulator [Kitasatospora sp. DSM 101779]|uniref:GntR family transcriptional regulator n=1 Tax=Kitasatospora sp. DSM 101779 TaxID=2853165 RepID=UPI0021DADDEF|nr:GntR family transcriptional regulator [Kitasatospora sp. DSM 101779]